MKKITAIVVCLFMLTTLFYGCTSANKSGNDTNKKLNIVCTIFPEYDWVKEILGEKFDNANVSMLLNGAVDMHSYQPSADDIIKIASCDLFIYVGGESDKWVDDALKQTINKNMISINLLQALGDTVKEEEIVEGMETEAEEDASSQEAPEYDEHVWLSLKNSKIFCQKICDEISKIDADNATTYSNNTSSYISKLDSLDNQYKSTVDSAKIKTLVFGDRFPFRYLVDNYGIDYFAAFVGCSAETEASFETIVFLARKVDLLKLNSVMTIENSDQKIAKTIIENTESKNQKILSFNSMQSVTDKDIGNGVNYLSIMQNNLSVLKDALN